MIEEVGYEFVIFNFSLVIWLFYFINSNGKYVIFLILVSWLILRDFR